MAKKAAAKQSDIIRCKVEVKHEFSVDEYKERTTELTTKMKNVEIREDNLKAQQATAKAEIKALKADVNDLANQLRNGFELRNEEATVEFNKKKGTKRYYFFAPGKPHHKSFAREDAMTEEDFQEMFPEDTKSTDKQPIGEAAEALQQVLERNQVAGDEEPARVQSADAAE